MTTKNVLITGSSGNLGSFFLKKLKVDFNVYGVSRKLKKQEVF